MNVEILWSNLLAELKNKLTSLSYGCWFQDTTLYQLKDGKAYIIVPMTTHKKHISENYSDLITSILYDLTQTNYELVFLLNEEVEEEKNKEIEKEERKSMVSQEETHEYQAKSNLNPNYTFDTFIVGNSNKFAHAAALSVAEQPGKMYNPLFLYGNSGVGKTHLMHAIGNYIQENSNKRVLYVTAQQFIDEFVKITRKDEGNSNFNYIEFFKSKYRDIDVLIIDDIQFLGGAQNHNKNFSTLLLIYLMIVNKLLFHLIVIQMI